MRRFALISLMAATSALSACAPTSDGEIFTDAATRPERQCFDADRVSNFRVSSVHTIYVRDHRDRVFQLDSAGGCTDLDSTFSLALVPRTGRISRLCTGDTTDVLVRGQPRGNMPCRAQVTRMLTDEQVAALADRDRP